MKLSILNMDEFYLTGRSVFFALVCFAMFDVSCKTELESLHFSYNFEGGAATDFHVRRDGAIGFSIPEEPGVGVVGYHAKSAPGEYLWFCFKVVNDGKKPLDFVLDNAFGAHQTGWRWKITKPVFSTDGNTWVRAEYAQYSYLRHRLWKHGIKLLGKPEFRFRAPMAAETLWVAYFNPYVNRDLRTFIDEIRQLPGVTISTIGRSEENREIFKIQIDRSSKVATNKEGAQIWVICREHPGETPASFVCEGFIDALLKHHAGKRLRETYGFSIIPILNVDGVVRGYYYHNARGVDLAFDWQEFRSTEARILRDAIADDVWSRAVRLVLNLHASNDPTKGHFFLRIAESGLKPIDVAFQRSILKAADGIYPQFQGHSPVRQWDGPSITGNALYRQYGVPCLYLECNYNRGADGSVVTPESLRETGAALVEALARVLLAEE